jgi:hypothetical protein
MGGGTAQASGLITIYDNTWDDTVYTLSLSGLSFQQLDLRFNDEYTVTMTALAWVTGSGMARTILDPFIQIDPNCDCSQDFQLLSCAAFFCFP